MTAGTHFALPIIAAAAIDLGSVVRTGRPLLTRWQMLAIGLSGLIPDVLSPHFSLHGRLTSWTHTGWFALGVLAVSSLVARLLPGRWRPMIFFCCLAVWLHILCDLVSGGVNLLPPWTAPTGVRWIPFPYWLSVDAVTLLTAYLICWCSRQAQKRQATATEAEADG